MLLLKYILFLWLMVITHGRDVEEGVFYEMVDKFSMMLNQKALKSQTTSVIISPIAIQLLWLVYSHGSGRITYKDILKSTSHEINYTPLTNYFGELSSVLSSLSNQTNGRASFRTKIYMNRDRNIDEHYEMILRGYRIKTEKVDFENIESVIKTISKWASKNGHDNAENITDSTITPDTTAALINVNHISSDWPDPFTLTSSTKKYSGGLVVPMMLLNGQDFFYYESKDLNAKALELPFKDTGFSIVIILPKNASRIHNLIEDLANVGLREILKKLYQPKQTQFKIEIPKISFSVDLDVNRLLSELNLSALFQEPAQAFLNNTPINLSALVQNARFELNEKGVVFSSITSLSSTNARVSSKLKRRMSERNANKPLFFAVLKDDLILYTGTLV